ncbi:hypothetical protein O3P69_014463 [Scylla paramamosain]|uniref:Uncharacterized protein n=1 Tax=Scylla paramamosain TaxID=85552 RepID=A0AAW0TBQ0_SCYPA
MPETRVTQHYPNARQGSVGARGYMAAGKNIDVGGVRPLVSRTEINCGRPGVSSRTGKPAYKSQEEQYQEIQELRQGLGHLREENSTLRTRSRRLEEDLARRDRQIQQLMDPTKVVRLRNQLNIVQQQQQQQQHQYFLSEPAPPGATGTRTTTATTTAQPSTSQHHSHSHSANPL